MTASGEISFQKSKLKKAEFFSQPEVQNPQGKNSKMNFPQIFFFSPKKMELEDKKREDIICLQASLIHLKRDRQNKKRCYERGDKEVLKQMAQLQNEIKQKQGQIESATDCIEKLTLEEIYIDGKPLTDLVLDRRMEEDFEKELEELEKNGW